MPSRSSSLRVVTGASGRRVRATRGRAVRRCRCRSRCRARRPRARRRPAGAAGRAARASASACAGRAAAAASRRSGAGAPRAAGAMRVASAAGTRSVGSCGIANQRRRRDGHEAAAHAVEVGRELVGAARSAARGPSALRARRPCASDSGIERRERPQRRRLVRDVLHRDRDGRVALERHPAGEHLVEHDAERVDVGLRARRCGRAPARARGTGRCRRSSRPRSSAGRPRARCRSR